MVEETSGYRWREGVVDAGESHIELRSGNAGAAPYKDWKPIARIGRPRDKVFPVEWLLDPNAAENVNLVSGARRELDLILVESHPLPAPSYAIYWCGTAGNMYSNVHWSYFPHGQGGPREASKVVRLPEGGLGVVQGDGIGERPRRKRGRGRRGEGEGAQAHRNIRVQLTKTDVLITMPTPWDAVAANKRGCRASALERRGVQSSRRNSAASLRGADYPEAAKSGDEAATPL